MTLTCRPYSDADFAPLWRLLQRDYAARRDGFTWLVSRFGDWKYGLWGESKYIPTFFPKNAQVWADGLGETVGAALSEDGGNVFFIFTAPGFDYLYETILDWVIAHWRERFESLVAEVQEAWAPTLATLEARGFRRVKEAAITRAYDVAQQAARPPVLPDGFRIVSIQEEPDYRGKRLVQKNAFAGVDGVTALDLEAYEYSRLSPAYDPWLDLSVVDPDGVHAASCLGFLDTANRISEIERVCTHSAYRRRGLAEAVIRACFQRLAQRGVERAYITAYGPEADALYEKLGPVARRAWAHYELLIRA